MTWMICESPQILKKRPSPSPQPWVGFWCQVRFLPDSPCLPQEGFQRHPLPAEPLASILLLRPLSILPVEPSAGRGHLQPLGKEGQFGRCAKQHYGLLSERLSRQTRMVLKQAQEIVKILKKKIAPSASGRDTTKSPFPPHPLTCFQFHSPVQRRDLPVLRTIQNFTLPVLDNQ
ncbi:hypothetical protein L345_08118, partial [Ophiophagus hannah]